MKTPPRWIVATAAALVAAVVVAIAVALFFTSRPAFFARYSALERRHTTLQTSGHRDIACVTCHVDPRNAFIAKAALVGDFYRSLVGTMPGEPLFVRLPTPSNAACLACHSTAWSNDASKTAKVPHPAHLRVASETRDCVKCHKWTAHEETYQAKHTTMPFSGVCASFGCHVGTKPATACVNCHHVLQQEGDTWLKIHSRTVRGAGQSGCLEKCHDADQCRLCHTTGKKPTLAPGIATARVTVIELLHVKKDWLEHHGTVALQDEKKCTTCHVSDGECIDCHSERPAFHGPTSTWLTAHKPLAKDERRCLACHEKPWCEDCHEQFKEIR